jgi:hypothetical protein
MGQQGIEDDAGIRRSIGSVHRLHPSKHNTWELPVFLQSEQDLQACYSATYCRLCKRCHEYDMLLDVGPYAT